jgi:hypothetical protein
MLPVLVLNYRTNITNKKQSPYGTAGCESFCKGLWVVERVLCSAQEALKLCKQHVQGATWQYVSDSLTAPHHPT